MTSHEAADALIAPYLRRWDLIRDGRTFTTPSSVLVPVVSHSRKAFLKVATEREEELGFDVVWVSSHQATQCLAISLS